MKKMLPIILAILGLGGGLAGGSFLKPADVSERHAKAASDGHGETAKSGADHGSGHGDGGKASGSDYIYVGLEKPFFAPVIHANNRQTLVRLDIHLEVPASLKSSVEKHDPKLRDGFLRTVMNFANEGGFARVHDAHGFATLRDDLLLSARSVIGDDVRAVLIGEILTRES